VKNTGIGGDFNGEKRHEGESKVELACLWQENLVERKNILVKSTISTLNEYLST
jgi:hypothetical protein